MITIDKNTYLGPLAVSRSAQTSRDVLTPAQMQAAISLQNRNSPYAIDKPKSFARINLSAESYHAVREVAQRAFAKEKPGRTGLFRNYGYVMSDTLSTVQSVYATNEMVNKRVVDPGLRGLGLTSAIKVVTSIETARIGYRTYREGVRVNCVWNRVMGVVTGIRSGLEFIGGVLGSAAVGLTLSNVHTQAAAQAAPVLVHGAIGSAIASGALMGGAVFIGAVRSWNAYHNFLGFQKANPDNRSIIEYLKNQVRLTDDDCVQMVEKLFGEKGISEEALRKTENRLVFAEVLKETKYELKSKLDALNSIVKKAYFMQRVCSGLDCDVDEVNATNDKALYERMKETGDGSPHKTFAEGLRLIDQAKKTRSEHLIDVVMDAIPDGKYVDPALVDKARELLYTKLLQKSEQKMAIAKAAFPTSSLETILHELATDTLTKGDGCEVRMAAFIKSVNDGFIKSIALQALGGVFLGIVTVVSYLATLKVELFEQVLLTGASVLLLILDAMALFKESREMTPDALDKLKMMLINVVIIAAVVTAGVLSSGVVPIAVAAIGGALTLATKAMVDYNQSRREQVQPA